MSNRVMYISRGCPHCKKLLIGRDWYELSEWYLDHSGCCVYCKTKCPGFFEKDPGNWGSQRLPVSL